MLVVISQTMSLFYSDDYNGKSWDNSPYSSDMNPCDFNLFPKLKESLRGRRFQDVSFVLCAVVAVSVSIVDVNNQHLVNILHRLSDVWQKVTNFATDYLEGE